MLSPYVTKHLIFLSLMPEMPPNHSCINPLCCCAVNIFHSTQLTMHLPSTLPHCAVKICCGHIRTYIHVGSCEICWQHMCLERKESSQRYSAAMHQRNAYLALCCLIYRDALHYCALSLLYRSQCFSSICSHASNC